jgi:hypothetical protein
MALILAIGASEAMGGMGPGSSPGQHFSNSLRSVRKIVGWGSRISRLRRGLRNGFAIAPAERG